MASEMGELDVGRLVPLPVKTQSLSKRAGKVTRNSYLCTGHNQKEQCDRFELIIERNEDRHNELYKAFVQDEGALKRHKSRTRRPA